MIRYDLSAVAPEYPMWMRKAADEIYFESYCRIGVHSAPGPAIEEIVKIIAKHRDQDSDISNE